MTFCSCSELCVIELFVCSGGSSQGTLCAFNTTSAWFKHDQRSVTSMLRQYIHLLHSLEGTLSINRAMLEALGRSLTFTASRSNLTPDFFLSWWRFCTSYGSFSALVLCDTAIPWGGHAAGAWIMTREWGFMGALSGCWVTAGCWMVEVLHECR